MSDYTLLEAANLLGEKKITLYRRIKRGKLQAILVDGEYKITKALLRSLLEDCNGDEIKHHIDLWLQRLQDGYYTYKGKTYSATTIKNMRHGIEKYLSYQQHQTLECINSEQLRLTLSQIKTVPTKQSVHKAYVAFLKHLINEKLRGENDLETVKKQRPSAKGEPRRTYMTYQEFQAFVRRIEKFERRNGRSKEFMKTAVFLAVYGGLRRSEIINVHLSHIDFAKRQLWIIEGKGDKTEPVAIPGPLREQLETWLEYRPKSHHPNLLLAFGKEPATTHCLQNGLVRLREEKRDKKNKVVAPYVDITWHGLRRTCATVLAELGCDPLTIQTQLRHSEFSMTEKAYIMGRRQMAAQQINKVFNAEAAPEIKQIAQPLLLI